LGSKEGGRVGARQSTKSAVRIKDELHEEPSMPRVGNSQLEVIGLSDSPPTRQKLSSAKSTFRKQVTIKSEPEDPSVNSKRPAFSEQPITGIQERKKIKLEPGAAPSNAIEDPDLGALEDEIRREEEELAITQRAAQLMRQTNEKAKLTAPQHAKRNGTPISK